MVTDIKGRLVEKPQYGGTLAVYAATDPITWDPFVHLDGGVGYMGMVSIYDRFTGGDWSVDRNEFSFKNLYIPPKYSKGYMMESYESPDPLTYVIHLRKGVLWQNKEPVFGREVTATDVKYSIDRLMGLEEFATKGPAPIGISAWNVVKSVDVVDKYTVKLNLKNASALFPEYWGTEIGPWIHPREVVDKYGNNFAWQRAVGSGPWQVSDVVSGSSVTYLKNPTYYGVDDNFPQNHIPYADKMKVLIIPDLSTALSALRTGKIDIAMGLSPMDAPAMKKSNPELKWTPTPSVARNVCLRVDLKPYSDINVRKAMQMAIDLKGLAQNYYLGTADPYPFGIKPDFKALFTPLDQLPKDVQEPFTYNPTKAKQMLADAGYPNGFSQVLPESSAMSALDKGLMDLFISYWEAIGIKTTIKTIDSASYTSWMYGGNQQIGINQTSGYWMPTQILVYWYGGQKNTPWNYANANDPKFNAMWDAIQTEPDPAKRDTMIKATFVYSTSQFWYVAGPSQTTTRFWQPWIKGYQGEDRMQAVNYSSTWARIWIDTAFKYKSTGVKD
jgi:peptide/nickel transport system substrate-binding protein